MRRYIELGVALTDVKCEWLNLYLKNHEAGNGTVGLERNAV
jgi:hypothetical protein